MKEIERKIVSFWKKENQGNLMLFCLLVAAVTITFCSRSSFLSPFNNWDDVNSYFSMGKALFNGKVIYRDILDQKGPYLYLIYGLGYLLSNTDFKGVYLIEIILAGVFLYGCLKILLLYVNKTLSVLLLPFLSAVIYSSVSFWWGGSAEEICLPFFVWPLFFMLKFFKEDTGQCLGRKEIAITGVCSGMVALIKFNSLGFFAAWMLAVVVIRGLKMQWKEMVYDCIWFLGWMFLPFVPWFVYFGIHGALFYWYQGYVHYNVFIYADFSREAVSLGERIYKLAKILLWLIIEHIQYFAFIIVGVLTIVFHPKRKWMEKFAVLAMCFFLFFGIYIGGVELKYYSLPLSVFTVLGFAAVGMFLQWCIQKKIWDLQAVKIGGAVFSLLLAILLMRALSLNTEYMKTEKEDLYVYKLLSHMEVTEDTTMLNISCFDMGLYTVSGIVPNCYWFQTQTLPLDDVLIDQEEYIRSGKIDYIVAREYYPAAAEEGYEVIAQEEDEARDTFFYLLKKKE